MMQSISIKNPPQKPYLTTGHQLYMIGTQDGLFPEEGAHLAHQMWGIWAPPIKILNGFWARVNHTWLLQADCFEILPYGAKFQNTLDDVLIERFQFVPQKFEGFVVTYTFHNRAKSSTVLDFTLGVESNLLPSWLGDRIGKLDGEDYGSFSSSEQAFCFRDSCNPWTVLVGSDFSPVKTALSLDVTPPQKLHGKGVYGELSYSISLQPDETKTLTFFVASSSDSPQEAHHAYHKLIQNHQAWLTEKMDYYANLESRAKLSFPQKPHIEQLYRWTQYANDWIIREVKKIGIGLAAGYAEFPWWFGNDSCYTIPALLMQGEEELCKNTLRLIKSHSEEVNKNGRVVHEISNNGVVFYEGMTTETPQFTDAVWQIYRWTGDQDFLKEMYSFCKMGMQWLESMSVDGMPTGYGITEYAGLNCICVDSVILAARGYDVFSQMATVLGESDDATQYRKLHEHLMLQLEKNFWLESQGIYGDMLATKSEIMERAESWKYSIRGFPISEEDKAMASSSTEVEKSPKDAEGQRRLVARMDEVLAEATTMTDTERRAFNLFDLQHSVDFLEYGYGDVVHARRILKNLKQYAITGVASHAEMPIFMGRLMLAQGTAQEPDSILETLEKLYSAFGLVMPGATTEIFPDSGCFVQAWNSYASMWPFAHTLFGIRPNAYEKSISLSPCLNHTFDGMALKNVRIGGEGFDFSYTNGVITVTVPNKEWLVTLDDVSQKSSILITVK